MERDHVKRDNRRALPKYLLLLLLAGIFGGVLGFAAGWMGHDRLSEAVSAAITGFLEAIAPWAIPVTSLVSLSLILWLYRAARSLFSSWDGEDEAVMDQAEEKLSWALLLTSAQLILNMFFFAVVWTYGGKAVSLAGILCFLVSMFLLIFAQQKLVDLNRRMNPEKKGSVYDVNFRKKWLESCDEAEQRQIGQAAYKAFITASSACPILWMVLTVLNIAFRFDLVLPVFLVCLLWLLLSVSYCLECIRLSRRK